VNQAKGGLYQYEMIVHGLPFTNRACESAEDMPGRYFADALVAHREVGFSKSYNSRKTSGAERAQQFCDESLSFPLFSLSQSTVDAAAGIVQES